MDVATAPDSLIPGFHVRLENFDGPFDLLLQLIAKHKMDVTEVALATVTDEFIGYIRNLEREGEGWDLEKATEFLVVAATLLDLKAARLLPSGEIDDEADLALLEARDLLFARLLQYRAFKQIASLLEEKIVDAERSFPRVVSLEPHLAELLPEVVLGLSPDRFAALAERALSPREELNFSTSHLHLPLVSVAEEGQKMIPSIKASKIVTFRTIAADAPSHLVVIARFLALLELFREGVIRFQQLIALGDLTIEWIGEESATVYISDEFDRALEPADGPGSDNE
jgi:segregation and condensation protein A